MCAVSLEDSDATPDQLLVVCSCMVFTHFGVNIAL